MDKPPKYTFSELLKQFRAREDMTQQELAHHLGVNRNTIVAWESGSSLPKMRTKVEELAKALHLSEEQTIQLLRAGYWEPVVAHVEKTAQQTKSAEVAHPLFWNLPYRRNPFFTGRGAILKQLHETLTASKKAALTQLQAISGLGGIGKTQAAVEYAYRYRRDYQTVLWARADTAETLIVDLVSIASLLGLPEKDEQDRSSIVTAVKRWLEHTRGWLLILDNVDDLTLAHDFLPAQYGGHVLLTTREQVIGTLAPQIRLGEMTLKEGAFFLLRRVKLIAPDALPDDIPRHEWKIATAIVETLAGLPLALDQAGAYIEETACGLAGYLKRYEKYRAALLEQRGSGVRSDHPESVASTWSLSFQRVEQASAAAAELLRLCAFLHPDGIPEEILIEGAAELGPILAPVAADLLHLDAIIGVLRRYSLLHRHEESRSGPAGREAEQSEDTLQSLTIHRLVQAVLKDAMDEAVQRLWAERAVRAVGRAFPADVFAHWYRCQRLLPQTQTCAELIQQFGFAFPEAIRLLGRAASYLRERGEYPQAWLLLQQALTICEQTLDPMHPETAGILNDMAGLARDRDDNAQSLPLFQRALAIREQILGPDHPDVAQTVNNLALTYEYQGNYAEAEVLYRRALKIWQDIYGAKHVEVLNCLNNLANLYEEQGKYDQAEECFQQVLTLRRELLGANHPQVAQALNNLAACYQIEGKFPEAEPLFLQALAIWERAFGPEHAEVATCLNNVGLLCINMGKYTQAERYLQRAIVIRERILGPEHSYFASSLNNLAKVYYAQGKYEQAEQLQRRSLSIKERVLGVDHPFVANSLNNLGEIYRAQGDYVQASQYHQRALAVREKILGQQHPDVATSLNNLAVIYILLFRYAEAEQFLQRTMSIREQTLDAEHPDMASALHAFGQLYHAQKLYGRAEDYFAQAFAIREKALGKEHPDVAHTLHNLATLYSDQGLYMQAKPLLEQALAIRKKALGTGHPDTVNTQRDYDDLPGEDEA